MNVQTVEKTELGIGKCVVNASEFKRVLARVGRASSSKSTLPILRHVKISKIGQDSLMLSCTDLEIHADELIAAEGEFVKSFTMPVSPLRAALVGAEGELLIDRHAAYVRFVCGNRTIECKDISDAENFPLTPNSKIGHWRSIPGFARLFELVKPAIYQGGDRPALCSILVDNENLVATNTHLLHAVGHGCDLGDWPNLLIPESVYRKARGILGLGLEHTVEVGIAVTGDGKASLIKLCHNGRSLIARLGPYDYPNYKKIIPSAFDRVWTVDSRKLLPILSGIGALARENNNRVIIEYSDGELTISAEDYSFGTMTERLELEDVSGNNSDFNIAFSYIYLSQAVQMASNTDDIVQMKINHPLEAIVVSPGDTDKLAVLMPMQIR